MVTFKEDSHQYFNERGEEYTSVTRMLHEYTTPFAEDAIAAKVAKKEGVTKEEILAKWKEANTTACDFGTEIHLLMENYIKTSEKGETEYDLYKSFDEILKAYCGVARWNLLSEVLLWDDEYKIAGTSDIIVNLNEHEFAVGDFKTNKKLNFYSPFGNIMAYPVDHLSDCNFSVYSLQLSVYAYFYERLSGKRCRNTFLLYLNDGKWSYISANYLKYEVMALLRHFKNRASK